MVAAHPSMTATATLTAVPGEDPIRGCSGVPSSHRRPVVVVQPVGDGNCVEPSSPRRGRLGADPRRNPLPDTLVQRTRIACPDSIA